MIFFTADQHLFHTNIIRMKKRPYKNVNEMTEDIIAKWNSVVHEDDTVYHLGDFIGKEQVDKYAIKRIGQQLNGHKILLKGNHDKNYPMKEIFETVYEPGHVETLCFADTNLYLNHKLTHLTVTNDFPQALYIHGHAHNKAVYNTVNQKLGIPCYDVGVDANSFTPVSIETIIRGFENPPPKDTPILCSSCGRPMILRTSIYGQFYGCSGYPKCDCTASASVDRRPAAEKIAEERDHARRNKPGRH